MFFTNVILGFVLVFDTISDRALVCACLPATPQQAFEKADAVFSAVVTELHPLDEKRSVLNPEKGRAILKTVKVWKGKIEKTVAIHSVPSTEPCDIWRYAKRGETFLIYARYIKIEALFGNNMHTFHKLLITDHCMRSGPLKSAEAAADLRLLGPGKNP